MMVFESSIGENLNFLKQFLKAAIFSRKISSIKDMVSHLYGCMKYLLPIIIRFIKDHRVFVPANSRISLVIQSEQIPNLESRVTIDPKDLDQFELPRVILDWRVNLAELKTIREFAIATKNSLECLGLSKVKIPEALLSLDPKFFMQLRDTNHQSGGLRMGRDSNDGVVDRDLRVFGTDNLFILGASTFRTISNANITFTAIAFASRLVDLLKDKNADN
jgi:choline dehydrogenase-like flavoprotein